MPRKSVRPFILLSVFAGLCGLFSFGCPQDQRKTVKVMGSTSIQPFAEDLGREFEAKHPGRKAQVEGGGSTAGIQALADGLADIGMCSRRLKEDEADRFTPVLIARDGLAIIVHPSNPVDDLSVEQLRGLFSGSITNWKDVGGNDAPVRIVSREEGSGTREAFMNLVMGKTRVARRAMVQASNGAIAAMVRSDPSAIGYMSLGQIGNDLKTVRVNHEAPTAESVLAGRYKLARPFLFVTSGKPGPDAQAFIDFVLSAEGQEILESEGLIRVK